MRISLNFQQKSKTLRWKSEQKSLGHQRLSVGDDGGLAPEPQRHSCPLMGVCSQKLNHFSYITANFSCNFTHKLSKYAKKSVGEMPGCGREKQYDNDGGGKGRRNGQCLRSRVDNTGLRTTGGLRFEDTQSSTGVNCEV